MNRGYRNGQWDAYETVLSILNTFDEKQISKSTLYSVVLRLRPKKPRPWWKFW